MTRNPMFDLDEDDADARAVDRAYANAPEAPGPVHRIPAIDAVRAELRAAVRERDEARAFKAYVHKRLDDAGVSDDPAPEETAKHGCRIEGRLDVVLGARAERDVLAEELNRAQGTLAELRAGALLAIDAKRHGSQLDYENFVGLLLNALAGSAAVGMPGEGVAVDETALRVVGGGR